MNLKTPQSTGTASLMIRYARYNTRAENIAFLLGLVTNRNSWTVLVTHSTVTIATEKAGSTVCAMPRTAQSPGLEKSRASRWKSRLRAVGREKSRMERSVTAVPR